MRSLEYALLPIIAAVLPAVALGQTSGQQPVKTTLCELNGDPERFDGKIVEFRAGFVSKFLWEGFADESCSAKIQVGLPRV